MTVRLAFPLLLACALAGCGDAPHQGRQEVDFGREPAHKKTSPPANHAPLVDLEPRSSGELPAALASLEKRIVETQQSNNATQQSLSGLGLQLGKVAEKVDASLVKVEANLQQTVQAHANLNAQAVANLRTELRAELSNEIQATASAQATANAKLEAQLQALAQAQGAAQMALNARLEQTTNNLNAGRDNIQFTPEMAHVFIAMLEQVAEIVGIVVGVVIGLVTALSVMSTRNVRILAIENFKSIKVLADMAVKVDGDPSKGSTRRIQPPLPPGLKPQELSHGR